MTISPISSARFSTPAVMLSPAQLRAMIVSFVGRPRGGDAVDGGQSVEVKAANRADAISQVKLQYIVDPDSAIEVNVIRSSNEA